MNMIYVDYAATTPMTDAAIQAYAEVARKVYGNTSSLHDAGGSASTLLEMARTKIANKLSVNRDGIIFTGSGTEGNIIAILSLARAGSGNHVITSEAEHTSIHAAMNTLEQEGFEITKLPFKEDGVVDMDLLEKSIRPDTVLISIQHVNSEIGSIQPVEEIAKLARQKQIRYHVDCVQSFCKLPIEHFANEVDALTVSAHKIGGPKGCGVLYINPHIRIAPVFPGVTHEKGIRGGTVDTPAIVATVTAMDHFIYQRKTFEKYRKQLKEHLRGTGYIFIEAEEDYQLPSICGLCIDGIEGQLVMLRLNEEEICISTGSACDINSASGSKAVTAMGHSSSKARQFFRVSFGEGTTDEHIEKLGSSLKKIAEDIQR